MSSSALTYVKAYCHCTSNKFLIPFVTAKLPQATDLCHCSSCRHITGQLAVHCAEAAFAPLAITEDNNTPTKPADLSKLSKYQASPAFTRYFCTTCGAYMLYESRTKDGQPRWTVSTGALERTEGIVKVGYHAFIKDTKDGGLSKHYRKLDGIDLPRYAEEDPKETLPIDWTDESLNALQKQYRDKIQAHCHCRKISFYLSRPKQQIKAEANIPKGQKPRFKGQHCLCTDCRLSTGSLIPSWISNITRANISDYHSPDPDALITLSKSSPTRVKHLTQYNSSPGVFREFCSTCGATVFWWTKGSSSGDSGQLPNADTASDEVVEIEISAGLMDEEQGGALAEDWISWGDEISFGESALDRDGAKAVADGLRLIAQSASKGRE